MSNFVIEIFFLEAIVFKIQSIIKLTFFEFWCCYIWKTIAFRKKFSMTENWLYLNFYVIISRKILFLETIFHYKVPYNLILNNFVVEIFSLKSLVWMIQSIVKLTLRKFLCYHILKNIAFREKFSITKLLRIWFWTTL